MTQKVFSRLKGLNSDSTLVGLLTSQIYGNDLIIYIDDWEMYTSLTRVLLSRR